MGDQPYVGPYSSWPWVFDAVVLFALSRCPTHNSSGRSWFRAGGILVPKISIALILATRGHLARYHCSACAFVHAEENSTKVFRIDSHWLATARIAEGAWAIKIWNVFRRSLAGSGKRFVNPRIRSKPAGRLHVLPYRTSACQHLP